MKNKKDRFISLDWKERERNQKEMRKEKTVRKCDFFNFFSKNYWHWGFSMIYYNQWETEETIMKTKIGEKYENSIVFGL
jgi:hypothetical protein